MSRDRFFKLKGFFKSNHLPAIHKGFTLLEALVIVAVIGVLVLIALAAFGGILRRHRLNKDAREVMAAMAVARIKATSANFNYKFTFDVANNTYQINGEEPIPPVPTQTDHPAFDVNGNGVRDTDTVFKTARSLQYATFSTASVTNPLPSGVDPSSVPSTTVNVEFNSYGVVVSPEEERCVVLQLGGETQAVCALPGGLLRLYRDIGSWGQIF